MDTKPLSHPPEFIALCNDAKQRVDEISTDQVKTMIDNKDAFYLIDVRDREEFEQGHLAQAQFLSKGWVEAKIHEFIKDKNETIVLYCGGGNRSILAADNLKKMGYQNILSMSGGIKKWIREGKPVSE